MEEEEVKEKEEVKKEEVIIRFPYFFEKYWELKFKNLEDQLSRIEKIVSEIAKGK